MTSGATTEYDVVVVGAGFAGVYMLHRAKQAGFTAHLYEAGDGPGGTWYWNRYPGARCDFESLDYSYSFDDELQQEWNWPERYSGQAAILEYIEHVTDRFGLRGDMTFGTRVAGASFDEGTDRWLVEGEGGPLAAARWLVMATGSLSSPRFPDIPGIDSFQGRTFHTGAWPDEPVDFTDRRVAVIGTGSSGVQVSVEIAKQAEHLYVLQRTPSFIVPALHEPLNPDTLATEKAGYARRRELARHSPLGVDFATRPEPAMALSAEERTAEFERRWPVGGAALLLAFPDLLADEAANQALADYLKGKIRDTVQDEQTAALLTAMDYPVGARRLVVGPGFHAMFNEPHVDLVDVRSAAITEFQPSGIETEDALYEVDDVVFATGYDAITGALLAMDIRGREGEPLRDHWAAGPLTYLGLQAAGFPNLFFINGPQSPSVFSNMVHSLEQHVQFIGSLLETARAREATTVEATADAESAWVQHVFDVASPTLFMKTASWYMGANVPGKPRVFMPYVAGVPAYRATCDKVVENDYEGFDFN
ncbi:flavin-containing monooxygenase [Streptomyces sp. NPDC058335]|uniref:flavin-containing monooxygenase n=1 Tax=Streptomyces sp. NPDC058335 TaxID=3346451 RepID=UPI00365E8844